MAPDHAPHELAHFLGDRVGLEGRRLGCRGRTVPGLAVLGVIGELAADRFAPVHQDPGAPAHGPVEGIHPERRSACLAEVRRGREPALMGLDSQISAGNEGGEVGPEFALGRFHHDERPRGAHRQLEGFPVGPVVSHDQDRHPASGLLEGKVALVGEHERVLLRVIRTSGGFPGRLHQDQTKPFRGLARQGTHLVCQLVVGGEYPQPGARLIGREARQGGIEKRGSAHGGLSAWPELPGSSTVEHQQEETLDQDTRAVAPLVRAIGAGEPGAQCQVANVQDRIEAEDTREVFLAASRIIHRTGLPCPPGRDAPVDRAPGQSLCRHGSSERIPGEREPQTPGSHGERRPCSEGDERVTLDLLQFEGRQSASHGCRGGRRYGGRCHRVGRHHHDVIPFPGASGLQHTPSGT